MTLRLVGTALYLAPFPTLLLLVGGDWRWPAGLLFSAWLLALCTSAIAWLYRKDPALLAERYRKPGTGGQSRRDQVIVYLLFAGFVAWIVLMPLDGRRYHWTPPLPLAVPIAGGALLAGAAFFILRAFIDNTFLSPLVRVQAERKQSVVSTGVYGLVRHPMYLGALLVFVGGPLLTGAASALAVGVAMGVVLALRIVDEEKLLARELDGYDDYRRRVRYRLVPYLW